ncbi:MAG TPA: NrfD/PsrC family molybdoenzyme membrane anchor subunit [Gemmatimonadaceae bacterium]|nr:NrfD/PsrC family molybdoenzyme membrane anchor subunit [Gemmatimonadaceae bacterium]
MPDTFFTEPPHWRWLIALYFFIGGIAGGCFFLAALLHLVGRPGDRAIVKAGYYVAITGVAISGILLILDLDRPDRFWHMMIQNKTGRLMFKYWSPMSVGVWGLLFFGLFAFLAALGALHEDGKLRFGLAGRLAQRPVSTIIAIAGGIGGFFLAGYTGVLLAVSNRPVWADSNWLGMLYLFSAASSAAAVLILLARRRRLTDGTSVHELERFDKYVLILELITLVIFLISLGSAAQTFLNAWGALLAVIIVGGIVAPLLIGFGRLTRVRGRALTAGTAAALVLLGGLMLRIVTIFPSEQVRVVGTRVTQP